MREIYCLPGLVLACVLSNVASAQTATSASVDVTASTASSRNPFGGRGNGRGSSGSFNLEIQPNAQLRTERDSVTLSGTVQLQQYFRVYSTRESYSAALSYIGRPNARLTTNALVSYANTNSGSAFATNTIVDTTNPNPPVEGIDVGLFGTDNRRQSINGRAGATYVISGRDQINAYATGISTSNSRPGLAVNYKGYGGGGGYSRQFSERLQLGVTGGAQKTEYTSGYSSTVYTAEGTFEMRVNARWTLTGSLGASFIEQSGVPLAGGGTGLKTALSGRATMCRKQEFGPICLSASRSVVPSTFGGTRVQSVVTATYSRRLSDRTSVGANLSYTQTNSAGLGTGVGASSRYLVSSLSFQRRLRERLSLSASANYRAIAGGASRIGDDYGGRIGVSYSFGIKR